MEYVLRDIECADPYIDNIIIGSIGSTWKETIKNHKRDVTRTLDELAKNKILISPKKMQLFMTKVEFCGHLLSEGKREPAPTKLLAVQKWELPKTISALRGFLGLKN